MQQATIDSPRFLETRRLTQFRSSDFPQQVSATFFHPDDLEPIGRQTSGSLNLPTGRASVLVGCSLELDEVPGLQWGAVVEWQGP